MRVKVKTLRCFEGDIKPTNIFRLRGLLGHWFRHERLEGRERLEGLPPFDEGGRVVLPDGILANTLDSTVCKVKPRSDTRDYRRQRAMRKAERAAILGPTTTRLGALGQLHEVCGLIERLKVRILDEVVEHTPRSLGVLNRQQFHGPESSPSYGPTKIPLSSQRRQEKTVVSKADNFQTRHPRSTEA